MSANSMFPNLAGQHDAYLIEALKAYQSGARDNVMMAATAKALSDADIRLGRHAFRGTEVEDRECSGR